MRRGGWKQILTRLEMGSCLLLWYEERVASISSRGSHNSTFCATSIVKGHACLATTFPSGSPNVMSANGRSTSTPLLRTLGACIRLLLTLRGPTGAHFTSNEPYFTT